MPRVENLGDNVHKWAQETHEPSSTYDVCQQCYTDIDYNWHDFASTLIPYGDGEPQGSLGWGGDVEHPDYEDTDYKCHICGKTLYWEDNWSEE